MGPAGLMAGTELLKRGFRVNFYDHKNVPARKFLVAGHGGFNLTNADTLSDFLDQYDSELIRNVVRQFTNQDLINFLSDIEIPTYKGTSGKIFPEKHIKPITVLNNWLDYIRSFEGVRFHFEYKLTGFDDKELVFEHQGKEIRISTDDSVIFAMGGGSWAKTGSTGEWLSVFESNGITVRSFISSNAGMETGFSDLLKKHEGSTIKNALFKLGEKFRIGEVVITGYGFEGTPVYYLNGEYRAGNKQLLIDFKPTFDIEKIRSILEKSKNITEGLKQLRLPDFLIDYLKSELTKEQFLSLEFLARKIKSVDFEIVSLRPVEESISTVGGILLSSVNTDFSLKKYPGFYAIGEMLDWDAPTGGYLLQACFSMGIFVGRVIEK